MKIDAPKTFMCGQATVSADVADRFHEQDVRIVRESDWRKIMAVVKAADYIIHPSGPKSAHPLDKSVIALRKHLEKRKP